MNAWFCPCQAIWFSPVGRLPSELPSNPQPATAMELPGTVMAVGAGLLPSTYSCSGISLPCPWSAACLGTGNRSYSAVLCGRSRNRLDDSSPSLRKAAAPWPSFLPDQYPEVRSSRHTSGPELILLTSSLRFTGPCTASDIRPDLELDTT